MTKVQQDPAADLQDLLVLQAQLVQERPVLQVQPEHLVMLLVQPELVAAQVQQAGLDQWESKVFKDHLVFKALEDLLDLPENKVPQDLAEDLQDLLEPLA